MADRIVEKTLELTSTRERVWAAIERLGYRPSTIARGLATQMTKTIGLVVPDIGNPFFSDPQTLKRNQVLSERTEYFKKRLKTRQPISLKVSYAK